MEKKPFITLEQAKDIIKDIPTPFHIYDEKGIRENARALNKAFSWNKGYKEYFAVKATPNPYLMKILQEEGCGMDCSSYTELELCEACGITGSDIMFSSNVTPVQDMKKAYELGANINLDDLTHVEFIKKVCGVPKTICCRYNPGGVFKLADSEEKVREEEARMKFAMIKRCLQICESEGLVVEDKKIIKELVVKNFPDFRKTVTELDTYSSNGVIDVGILNIINRSSKDMDLLFTLIKEKDIRSIRSLIPNFASNYSGFINQFYEQAMMRVSGSPRMVIKILAENQKYADTVPNMEIHLIDMLADMAIEVTWK